MSACIENEPAFILHTRPFRETSLIIEILTKHHGAIRAVAKGAQGQRAKSKHYLQPFLPVNISCYGKSDLLSLTNIEPRGAGYHLKGHALLSSIYVNELLVKILRRHQAESMIFSVYTDVLTSLTNSNISIEQCLRQFEHQLLSALGFGFSWRITADDHKDIQSEKYYAFDPELGFINTNALQGRQALVFQGSHLLAIDQNDFADVTVLRSAKQIMRVALTTLLDGVTLRSRELFLA